MAFNRKRLGGNIVASSVHLSMFLYASSTDTLAEISALQYFELANGKPLQGIGNVRGTEQIIFKDDMILVSGIDGFAIATVNAGADDITLEASEV